MTFVLIFYFPASAEVSDSRRIPFENIAKKATFQETKDHDDTYGFERTNGLDVRERVDYNEYPAVFKEIQGIYPGNKTTLSIYT